MLFQEIRPSHTKKSEKQHTGCDLTLSIGLWEDASSDDADGSSSISEELLPAPAAGARRVAAVKEEESKPAALNLDLTISSSWLG